MILLLTVVFWVSFAWIFYVFVGYPLLMAVLARSGGRAPKANPDYRPAITLVMAAYNEEKVIGEKIENFLAFNYPRELLSFFIGSDGSTDRTDEIITRYCNQHPEISLTRYERSGKTKIVYDLAARVESDIIIFTDADVMLRPDAVAAMARSFADPEVGGVVVRIVNRDQGEGAGNTGENRYLDMEGSLRRNESLYRTTVGPTGQCFAVRKGAYTPLRRYKLSDDLHLAITIGLNGYRVWYEPDAVIEETNTRTLWSEFRRRLRMGQQSAATFRAYRGTRYPWSSLVGFQIWSHKLLRNLAAFPASLLLITSLGLADQGILYLSMTGFCLLWLALILLGLLFEWRKVNYRLVQYPLYFTSMLLGLTAGSVRAAFAGGLEMWNSPRGE